jgi:hypothetical protein
MSYDFTKPKFVAIGATNQMRVMRPFCGELWIQENCTITATCVGTEEVGASNEAIWLIGVLDAVRWWHVLERDAAKIREQRIMIYSRFLTKL